MLQYIQSGKPNKIAFVERSNRNFREEVLDTNFFSIISQAQVAAETWAADYNDLRPHDYLGGMTPIEFGSRAFKPGISSFGMITQCASFRLIDDWF